ncbi:MAG TPA: amidohydrolase family protein [Acidimicrobiales bacterium]|nr:amidohydrolase family protein [Acidimicrobiales bacterium]
MGRVLFRGATVLDGEHLPEHRLTVVVEGNRITSVSERDSVEVGPDDRVVDLDGRTLMPGMVTCHFHATYHELGLLPGPFGLSEPPALQAVRAVTNLEKVVMSGFTSAVSAGAPFGIDASMRRAVDEGAIVGPRLVPGSRDVSTTGHANDFAPWYWRVGEPGALHLCDGPDEFRKAVRQEIKEGARIIKMFVTGGHGVPRSPERIEMTRDEMAAAIEAAHLRGAMVRGHIANRDAILMAVELGMDVIDHADGMDGECIDRIVAAGTFVVPSIFFLSRYAELMKDQNPAAAQAMQEELDAALAILPVAQEAGVRMVLGDDYGAAGFPHGIYGEELEFYVKVAGIAPLEVVRWATANGAALMGRADDLGTVTAGKVADLLVVDGDPITDISVLADRTRILAVMKDGRFVKDELPRSP